jgi:hypothetical protein
MAGLAIRSEVRELNPAVGSIGELKNVIFHSVLKARRFTDVVNTPGEVAGNRNGCRVSILHLHIADRRFWRVVVCACDGGFDKARGTVDEVFSAIDQLKFF